MTDITIDYSLVYKDLSDVPKKSIFIHMIYHLR